MPICRYRAMHVYIIGITLKNQPVPSAAIAAALGATPVSPVQQSDACSVYEQMHSPFAWLRLISYSYCMPRTRSAIYFC